MEGGGREWQGREGGGRESREARRPPATLVTPPQEEKTRGKRFSVGDLEDKVKYNTVQDSTWETRLTWERKVYFVMTK